LRRETRELRLEAGYRRCSEAFISRSKRRFIGWEAHVWSHAEARGVAAEWNTSLRAIKDADPVGLFPQDLGGS
jgi:hypothetical protein